MNAPPERTTLTSSLTQGPSTSRALERVRAGAAWLSAKATKLRHPDKQVRVIFSRPDKQEIFEVTLSGPETEVAIRQLMQAYADSIGKSLTFCVYPKPSVDYRMLSKRQYEGRAHRGIARDWNHTCTDNDCWCWGSEFHNPRGRS